MYTRPWLEGTVVGTLCAVDGAPRPARELDPVLFAQLTNLAALVASLVGAEINKIRARGEA